MKLTILTLANTKIYCFLKDIDHCNVTNITLQHTPLSVIDSVTKYAKQKYPRCKKGARPIRSSPTYVQPKSLILAEAKKSPIKDVLYYLNEFIAYFHKYDWLYHLATFITSSWPYDFC